MQLCKNSFIKKKFLIKNIKNKNRLKIKQKLPVYIYTRVKSYFRHLFNSSNKFIFQKYVLWSRSRLLAKKIPGAEAGKAPKEDGSETRFPTVADSRSVSLSVWLMQQLRRQWRMGSVLSSTPSSSSSIISHSLQQNRFF